MIAYQYVMSLFEFGACNMTELCMSYRQLIVLHCRTSSSAVKLIYPLKALL